MRGEILATKPKTWIYHIKVMIFFLSALFFLKGDFLWRPFFALSFFFLKEPFFFLKGAFLWRPFSALFFFSPFFLYSLLSVCSLPCIQPRGSRRPRLLVVTDGGWWMVDGGGWSKKRFSDFAQNFLRWSSDDINLFLFGNFVKSFFPIGKKSDFVPKIKNFGWKFLWVGDTFFHKVRWIYKGFPL